MSTDNTGTTGSPSHEEEGGKTRVAAVAAGQQQDDPQVYPITLREFVGQAPQEDVTRAPRAPRHGEGKVIDPSNGQQVMNGPANPPPPNLPVMVCNDEGNAKLLLGDSIEYEWQARKGTFLIGSGNGMMKYPPKERHVFTFKEMCGDLNEENSLAHVAGKPPM